MSIDEIIKDLEKNPLLKKVKITKNNALDALNYLDEIKNCKNCKGLEFCKNKTRGLEPVMTNDRLAYKNCKYLNKEVKYANVNKHFASNYLSDASLEAFNPSTTARAKALEYAYTFLANPKKVKGLYLYGKYATGKTYYLSALANALAQENYKSIIVFMPDLSRFLKNAMNDYTLEKRINELKTVDVLMLDDLGGEMLTSWLRDEVLTPIIQYRLMNNLPIFITSNLNYDQMESHFSSTKDDEDSIKANRLLARVREMTKRVIFNDSYKKLVNNDAEDFN